MIRAGAARRGRAAGTTARSAKNLSSERTVVLQSRAWLLPAAVALAKSGAVVGQVSCDVEVTLGESEMLHQPERRPARDDRWSGPSRDLRRDARPRG
jgi:hypothetical protein